MLPRLICYFAIEIPRNNMSEELMHVSASYYLFKNIYKYDIKKIFKKN